MKITVILFYCIKIMINILGVINILTIPGMGCIFMYMTGRRDKENVGMTQSWP